MTGTSADAIDGCVVSFDNDFNLIASDSIDHELGYKKNYEEYFQMKQMYCSHRKN